MGETSGEYSSVTMSKSGGGYVAIEMNPKKHSIINKMRGWNYASPLYITFLPPSALA